MRIQHNTKASNAYRNKSVNAGKLSKNLEKISSGFAVNHAADDAAGLAVSEKMRAEITGLEAAQKNARDGIGLIQTAEGALVEVHDMLDRMYYLCEEAANGTYDETDRAAIQKELDQLNEEIDRISANASFNGVKLLDGSLAPAPKGHGEALQFQIGATGDETLEVEVGLFDSDTVGAKWANLEGSNSDRARQCLPRIKNAIEVASSYRSNLGALQNRLEHTIQNLGAMHENMTEAESRIRDCDVAEEMMKFTKNSIMNDTSQAMMAQANQDTQSVMSLLQP